MAYDEGSAQLLRDLLAPETGIVEKRMFGGLCFMLNGNMLCGVHKNGGMFRVGKSNHAAALEIDDVFELKFTGRKMGGMVEVTDAFFADETALNQVMALAFEFVRPMPAK